MSQEEITEREVLQNAHDSIGKVLASLSQIEIEKYSFSFDDLESVYFALENDLKVKSNLIK